MRREEEDEEEEEEEEDEEAGEARIANHASFHGQKFFFHFCQFLGLKMAYKLSGRN